MIDREALVMPARIREQIVAHARDALPQECCGLIAGHGSVADELIRCRNQADTPETRYRIDMPDLRKVFEIEDAGKDLVAVYHSHPRSSAFPSPTDRQEAWWPEAFYVLVSLRTARPELFAYRIRDRVAVTEYPIVEPSR